MAIPASTTRVAVVQLAYHPAVIVDRRSPLEDPLYHPAGRDALLPERGDAPDALRDRLDALRRRVREAYGRQLLARACAALERCRAWRARLVVFPQRSVPWELLGGIADAAGDMVVIAGSHTVDRAARRSGVYERLVAPEPPPVGQEVFPVLHRGRLLALAQAAGDGWAPVPMPDGIPGPMGVLPAAALAEGARPSGMEACRFLAAPGATAGAAPDLAVRAWEEARRFGRPVLYCDEAAAGGTSLLVDEASAYELRRFPERAGYLEPGDEGVVVADVDLAYERGLRGARGGAAITPVAEATFVYRARPVADAYARWLAEGAPLLERDDEAALEALSQRVIKARELLLDAGALSGGAARGRRLRRLVADLDRILGVEDLRRFTREIVLPPSVLPLEALRSALARGAADSVFEWLKDRRGAGLDEVEVRLRRAGEALGRTGAGTWTIEGMAAAAAVALEVREPAPAAPDAAAPGPASGAPPPRDGRVRAVLPAGIDPAALGTRRARGLELTFRARPAELAGEAAAGAPISAPEPAPSTLPVPSTLSSAAPSSPRAAPPRSSGPDAALGAPSVDLRAAEDLFLLAIAEGAARVAAARVTIAEGAGRAAQLAGPPPAGEVLVVASRPDAAGREGWAVWSGSSHPWVERNRATLRAALAEAGIEGAAIEVLPRAAVEARIAALARRFEPASGVVAGICQRRLRDVDGCFVEPAVRVDGGEPRPAMAALDAWLASGAEVALLLGEFGAGKSTALATWADGLWDGRRARPILAGLAGASGAEDPERLLLDAAGVDDEPASRAALRLCVRRRLLLPCFDGFDELATRVGLRDLPAWLSRLLGVAAGGGQVVVSCRDGYFPASRARSTETERALAQVLGGAAGVARVVMQPFDEARVLALIERVRPGTSERALATIGRAYGLRDLVSRPLLLAMALATLDRLDPGAPIAAADLYEAYLRRWLDETRSAQAERLTDAQKEEFLESLADHLWRTGAPSCTFDELQQSVRARLSHALPATAPPGAALLDLQDNAFIARIEGDRERGAGAPAREDRERGASIHPREERPSMFPREERPSMFPREEREGAPAGEPRYRFAHRSFLEYFLSRGLVRTLRERPREALSTKPLTPEVVAFVGEILRRHGDPKDAEAVRAVQAWLGAGRGGDAGEAVELTADAAGNALRLLLRLRRWARQEGAWVPEGSDLRGVRMAGADLHKASLARARLDGVDLSGADLSGANLREAALDGAVLTGAVLDGASLARASAKGADFTQVGADGASLEGATLTGAVLRQSTWTGCRWEGVDAGDADVTAWAAPGPGALGERYAVSVRAPLSFASLAGGHWGPVRAVAWSPDGARLASAGEDGTVRLWNVVSGVELARLEGHRAPVTAIAWSPDGERVASASEDRTARIWDAASGAEAKRFERHRGRVNAVAWSPDGARVATAGDDGAVRIWDAASGTEQRCLSGHGRAVAGVAWSPRGDRLASTGADGALRIWDTAWGQELRRVDLDDARPGAVAWSAGGERVATAAARGGARLWDPATGEPAGHLAAGILAGIAWSRAGDRLAGAERDGAVWIWDLSRGRDGAALDGARRRLSAVAWSPGGDRLATAELDGTLRIWDAATGGELRHLDRHLGVLSAVAWSPSSPELASGSEDGTLRIWDARTGAERLRVDAHRRRISAVAWSPRGDRLASAGLDGAVRTWDLAPAAELARAEIPQGAACAIAWSAEGLRVASAGLDGVVRIADGASSAELLRLEGHASVVTVVAWSPDVALVASAGRDGAVRIWAAASGQPLHDLRGHTSDVNALAWSPRGDRLASTAHNDAVLLWDAAAGVEAARLTGHRAWVRALAWSPSGDRLATAGDDGTVRLWDAARGVEVACLEQRRRIRSVSWSPDGARLAIADRDGAIGVWDAARGALLCTLEAVDHATLARTPSGFCRFGGGPPERFRLTLRRPSPASHTELYLPLAGLRRVLHAPDRVAAALAGDLEGDDLRHALEPIGHDNGVPWDGAARRVTQRRRPAAPGVEDAHQDAGFEVRQTFNPFQPGYPLTVTLPGREQVVGEMLSLVQAHRPTVLRGPRRAGKTSILIHLEKRFVAARVRRVSLQGTRIRTPDDLARVLEPSLAEHRTPARALRRRLQRRDRGSRLVLLIDEVVYLVGADPSVFAWLRAIGQEGEASLVFAGSYCDWISVVQHAGSQPGSSFGNDMMVLSLGPIREEDAIRFLIDTSPADVGPVERAAHWIVELCGPWPFYLQVMGYELVKAVRAGDRRPLVERHSVLDLYERKLLFDWYAVFHDRWNELPRRVQRILRGLHRLPRGEMPGYADLSLDEQGALGDAGLCVPPGIWLKDPPFFDWIRRRGDGGKDGEDEHV